MYSTKASTSVKMSLKLMIDKETHKLIFAESGKEFVDFLFNLLNLPLGTVIRLLTAPKMAGSFGNLYSSVRCLGDNYIEPKTGKELLLKPVLLSKYAIPPLLTEADFSEAVFLYLFKARPPMEMSSRKVYYGGRPGSTNGKGGGKVKYVKGEVTFIITDDLVVVPMSMVSSMALLTKAGVRELGALEHRVVDVGKDEGLKLLMEALKSKEVLTNVFLAGNVEETTT